MPLPLDFIYDVSYSLARITLLDDKRKTQNLVKHKWMVRNYYQQLVGNPFLWWHWLVEDGKSWTVVVGIRRYIRNVLEKRYQVCSIKFSICFTRGASRLLLFTSSYRNWNKLLPAVPVMCNIRLHRPDTMYLHLDIHLISITNNSVSHAFCSEKILPILLSFIIMSFGMWCFFMRAGHGVKDRMPSYQLLLMALQRY